MRVGVKHDKRTVMVSAPSLPPVVGTGVRSKRRAQLGGEVRATRERGRRHANEASGSVIDVLSRLLQYS